MALLEKATGFFLNLLLENEEVKKFPKDFITASMQWVRSWFLVDDPKMEEKLKSDKSADYKQGLIETKLEGLLQNRQFVQELEAQLGEYERHKSRLKNVVSNANIEAGGDAHIGDTGVSDSNSYDKKNVVEGSTIKAGGNFRLGDDTYQAGGNFQIVNYYYQHAAPGTPPPVAAISALKTELRNLIAKGDTGAVLAKLADLSGQSESFQNTAFQLSGRWAQLKRQEMQGILSFSEAGVERSKISAAALELVGELP